MSETKALYYNSFQGNDEQPYNSSKDMAQTSANLELIATSSRSTRLSKPIVVPQTTNLFFIKTLSPFARCYSPELAKLPDPISQEEFLSFIDGLNSSFLSAPVFQASHVVGSMMMSAPILPLTVVGGVLNFGSLVASATTSYVRVRKYLKQANAGMFARRGLSVKIMSTKKMMATVSFNNIGADGKLKLPPLNVVDDLPEYTTADDASSINQQRQPEDMRLRRLKALEGYIAPIEFEEATIPPNMSKLRKFGDAPVRWMNERQTKKFHKAHSKSVDLRQQKSHEVEPILLRAASDLSRLDAQLAAVQDRGAIALAHHPASQHRQIQDSTEQEIHELEQQKIAVVEQRDREIADIYAGADKQLKKVYKKEDKVANRILWVVIVNQDGRNGDDEEEDPLQVDME